MDIENYISNAMNRKNQDQDSTYKTTRKTILYTVYYKRTERLQNIHGRIDEKR